MAQPSKRHAGQVRVELVPEHEGKLAAQPGVADLVQRVGQLRGTAHLGEVERQLLDPLGVEGRLGDRFNAKRLAGAGRSEDGDVQRARGGLGVVLAHQRPDAAEVLYLTPIDGHELAEAPDGNVPERGLSTLEGDGLGDGLKALRVADLED